MPIRHVVREGEDVASIAAAHGFTTDKVWNDAANADLKRKRKDPHILATDDIVVVPDRTPREESAAAGQKHKYKRKIAPAMLRLQLLNDDFSPRAGVDYGIEIDGKHYKGTTDGDGKIQHPLPPGAKKGTLVVKGEDAIPLRFADLDPVEEIRGVQQRLLNLGYNCGEATGEMNPATEAALAQFQKKHGLQETGQPDRQTRDKLRDAHGT